MLRGMHHATDVAAGVLLGIGAIMMTVFAAERPVRPQPAPTRRATPGRDPTETTDDEVAVIAHAGKTIGGGLDELRVASRRQGVHAPIWSEVPKSKYAPERVQRVLDEGAELVFVWGGDGMVQRSIDTLAGSDVTLAIIPAGTANLFASSLGIPQSIEEAVHIGLSGRDRVLDVGKINGERFAVMAGAGLDAHMIHEADTGLKDRFGRLAYIWTASKNLRNEPFSARIDINDELWYKGKASCILLGNVGSLFGGVEAFDNARPDDGLLEVGVTNAEGSASGREPSHGRRSARRASRRLSRSRRRRRSGSSSTGRFPSSSTVVPGTRRRCSKRRSNRARSRSECRSSREHCLSGTRDVGAEGRRRP